MQPVKNSCHSTAKLMLCGGDFFAFVVLLPFGVAETETFNSSWFANLSALLTCLPLIFLVGFALTLTSQGRAAIHRSIQLQPQLSLQIL